MPAAVAQAGSSVRSIGMPTTPTPGGFMWQRVPDTAIATEGQDISWEWKVVKDTSPAPKPAMSPGAKMALAAGALFLLYKMFG